MPSSKFVWFFSKLHGSENNVQSPAPQCVVSKHWKSCGGHWSQITVVFTVHHWPLAIQIYINFVYNYRTLILGSGAAVSNGANRQ